MIKVIVSLFIFLLLIGESQANFHAVGWFNTFVPGGGRLLMGNYFSSASEAVLEVGTFATGYNMSPYGTFTLDGTPIDFPGVKISTVLSKKRQFTCVKTDPITHKCTQYKNTFFTTQGTVTDNRPQDATKPLTAAFLQEFGLKYHLQNVFSAYRDQLRKEGGDPGQGIDRRSMNAMYLDPFRPQVLSSAWVYIPIAITAAFTVIDYKTQMSGNNLPAIARLDRKSKNYLAFDQLVVYPFGSSVPEEAFFRGFLQNEFYYLVRSPFFAIPMSAAAFAFSHSPDGRPSAFVAGLYQGLLAYKNRGDLSYGNAAHFWGVVIMGIEAYLLTINSPHSQSSSTPPAAFQFQYTF